MSVVRGCGKRKTGGCYAETELSSNGLPLDVFLIDPPIPVAEGAVKKVGVQLIERDGVWHILDWVGEEHYPTVPDFVEEMRRFGMSRRLPKTLDFSRLSARSRVLLVHAKARVINPETLAEAGPCPCYFDKPGHKDHKATCLYNAWQALPKGVRKMPSFEFMSKGIGPDGVNFEPGIFAAMPISRLVQVRASDAIKDMAKADGVPVKVVEE